MKYILHTHTYRTSTYEHRKQPQIHNLIRFRKITLTSPLINLSVSLMEGLCLRDRSWWEAHLEYVIERMNLGEMARGKLKNNGQ